MSGHQISRTAFVTSRQLEFLSKKELEAQCGHPVEKWALVVVKELADNALDALEEAGVAPEITITVDEKEGWIEVADNGLGVPTEIVDRLPDFSVRVSTREAYVAPDRGAQGNALRSLAAMPFVLHGEYGRIDIVGDGWRTEITIGIDRLKQKPAVLGWQRLQETGSRVRIRWPRELVRELAAIRYFAYDLAALNPHLTLTVTTGGGTQRFAATDPAWRKWRPSSPTSPHWYTLESFERLIGAYVVHDNEHRHGQPERTVRGFVSEFAGLSSTAKQKAILEATGLSTAPLSALISNGDFDRAKTGPLLRAMQAESKAIKPTALGVIGREHMRRSLAAWDTDEASFGYKAVPGFDDNGLPQIVEVAFAAYDEDGRDNDRRLIAGVNWSPALGNPFERNQELADRFLGPNEPIVLAVHVANPRVAISDRGKARVQITGGQIEKALAAVGQSWTKQRKAEERNASALARRALLYRARRTSLKDICFDLMEGAYMKASDDDSLPTHWRMVFYVIRPACDGHVDSDRPLVDTYFKGILEEYLEVEQPGWDIVRGARGMFKEPHNGVQLAMSTLNVRNFLAANQPGLQLGHLTTRFPTHGPTNRYNAILICEKEGFDELFEAEQIPARYDLALMSTKGISAFAARDLAEGLDIPCFDLHDFDKNGFVQAAPFGSVAEDIGIRMDDIDDWDLEPERQTYKGKKPDPWQTRYNLLSNGATGDEADFIAFGRDGKEGERVELNMFTARDMVNFVEGKLEEHGVKKVIPDNATLAQAWTRAHNVRRVNGAIESLHGGPRITLKGFYADVPPMPDQFRARIKDELAKDRTQTWDDVIWELVGQ